MLVLGKHTHLKSRYLKCFVLVYALTLIITIKLLNTEVRKITQHEITVMQEKLKAGDTYISLTSLQNGTNKAQSNIKLPENLHQPNTISVDMNSTSVTLRMILNQIGNVMDYAQFSTLQKKLSIHNNNTQMSTLNTIGDDKQSRGVKTVEGKNPKSNFNLIAEFGNKTQSEEFLQTYSRLCNSKTRRLWKDNHSNNSNNNKSSNNSNSISNTFCSCVPPTLREYKYFTIQKNR